MGSRFAASWRLVAKFADGHYIPITLMVSALNTCQSWRPEAAQPLPSGGGH